MEAGDKKITAFILAAGESRRFGAPKVLQVFADIPFLRRIRQNLQDIGIERPILVLGYQAQKLIPQIPNPEAFDIVVNPNFENGMFSSVQTAINAQPKSSIGTLLCLIDQPHIRPATYQRLMQSATAHPHSVIIPTFNQRGGHPIYIPSELFDLIRNAPPNSTLRALLNQYKNLILRIEVNDFGITEDIDTPEDLIRLEKMFK